MKTKFQKNIDIGRALGNRANAVPSKYYLGLSKTDVLVKRGEEYYVEESAYTEVTAADYKRVEINNNEATFTAPVDGMVKNAVEFEFAEATSEWGKVYAVGIYDALTGGNLRYIAALNKSKTVEDETSLRIKVGALEFTEVDVPVSTP